MKKKKKTLPASFSFFPRLQILTLPSITATHELVVPRSIPMISLPARAAAEALRKKKRYWFVVKERNRVSCDREMKIARF